jgi:hypothetical protein
MNSSKDHIKDPQQSKWVQSPYWSTKKIFLSAVWIKTLTLVNMVRIWIWICQSPNPDPNSINATAGYAILVEKAGHFMEKVLEDFSVGQVLVF